MDILPRFRPPGFRPFGFRRKPHVEDQLDRVEGLGLDCEVGFALRKLGNERPSIFRWGLTPPAAVLHLIETDFVDLFDVASLVPDSPPDVIRDVRNGMYFHSNLRVNLIEGKPCYVEPDAARRERVLRGERSLLQALAGRFRARYATPDTLYTLVRHGERPEAPIEAIAAAIRQRSRDTPFAVLEMCATPDVSRHGHVDTLAPGLYRGWLAFLHFEQKVFDFETALDHRNWRKILETVLMETAPRPKRWATSGRLDRRDARV